MQAGLALTYAHGSGASLGTHSPPKLAAELFPLINEMFPAITEIARPASAPTSSRATGPRGLLSSQPRAGVARTVPSSRPSSPCDESALRRCQNSCRDDRPTAGWLDKVQHQAFCSLRHSRRRGARRHARVAQFAFIALLALLATPQCRAEEHEMPNFKTMKIKELKAILADRGRECPEMCGEGGLRSDGCGRLVPPDRREPASGDETKEKPAEPDLNDADQERIRRMMDEMQNGPRPTGDPERDAILKKLHSSASSSPEERACPWTSSGTWRRPWGTSRPRNRATGTTNCERSRVVRWVSSDVCSTTCSSIENASPILQLPSPAASRRLSRSLRSFRSRRRRRVSDPVLDDDDEYDDEYELDV